MRSASTQLMQGVIIGALEEGQHLAEVDRIAVAVEQRRLRDLLCRHKGCHDFIPILCPQREDVTVEHLPCIPVHGAILGVQFYW